MSNSDHDDTIFMAVRKESKEKKTHKAASQKGPSSPDSADSFIQISSDEEQAVGSDARRAAARMCIDPRLAQVTAAEPAPSTPAEAEVTYERNATEGYGLQDRQPPRNIS